MSDERYREVVEPGPCPPQGCPPPTEIVCIKTKKVYQECKQADVFELPVNMLNPQGVCTGNRLTPPAGATAIVDCQLEPLFMSFEDCDGKKNKVDSADATSNTHKVKSCCEVQDGRIRFNLNRPIVVRVTLTFDNGQTRTGCVEIPEFSKTVGIPRAGTHPMFRCQVDLWVDRCLLCFIEELPGPDEIRCCINVILAFKLFAEVQLLVPAYGFCQPPECEEVLGQCPPAVDGGLPFPPQFDDDF